MSSPADTLIAYDRASGRPRWTAPAGGGGPASALVIDGRIIRTGVDRLTSIDGRAGQPLWTTPVELAEMSALATDGRVVLLTRPRPDGGSTLSAYGLDDGRLRWETELRRDNLWLIGVGGRLYGLLDQGLAALG